MGETVVWLGGLRNVVRRYPVTTFVVLVLMTSWPMLGLGGDQLGPPGARSLLWLLCPSACAFFVTWLAEGGPGVRLLASRFVRWRVPASWYLFALFGMGATYWLAVTVMTGVFFPAQLAPPPFSSASLVITVLGNVVVVFVVAGIGEEFGWRGFLLPRVSRNVSPVPAALVVGLVWWAWHIPIRLLGVDGPTAGLFLVIVLADSIVFAWVFHRTGGSVLIVALMHAAGNTWSSILHLTFTYDLVLIEAVRISVYVLVAATIVILTRGRVGSPTSGQGSPGPGRSRRERSGKAGSGPAARGARP